MPVKILFQKLDSRFRMKKLLGIILLIFMVQSQAWAQFIDENIGQATIRTKRTVLKIDPSLWFMGQIPGTGEYRLALEFAIGMKNSIQIGASYISKSIPTMILEAMDDTFGMPDYTINGFRFQFSYKLYPFGKYKNAPEGFFVGPHLSYTQAFYHFAQTTSKYSDYSITYANAALLVGYQFIAGDKFVIEVFQGLGYRDNRLRNEYTGEEERLNFDPDVTPFPGSFKIYFGANVGFNF